jgi:hypothetical protein
VLRAPFPGADRLELEETRPDVRFERRALEPLGIGQACRIDGGQATGERAQFTDLAIDGGAAEILQQIVVQMDTVEGGIGGYARYSSTKWGRGSAEYMQ